MRYIPGCVRPSSAFSPVNAVALAAVAAPPAVTIPAVSSVGTWSFLATSGTASVTLFVVGATAGSGLPCVAATKSARSVEREVAGRSSSGSVILVSFAASFGTSFCSASLFNPVGAAAASASVRSSPRCSLVASVGTISTSIELDNSIIE